MITLILGESGSGKTASIENLDTENTIILCPIKKPLSFKKKFSQHVIRDFDALSGFLRGRIKTNDGRLITEGRQIYIIDDLQFYILEMTLRYERALDALHPSAKKETFKIFKDIAQKIVPILELCGESYKRFYFLAHTEKDEDGFVCIKNGGKPGRSQLAIEGFFATVLKCAKDGQGHFFETSSGGFNSVKSPKGMFASDRIDNDLKIVDDTITAYYSDDVVETKTSENKNQEIKCAQTNKGSNGFHVNNIEPDFNGGQTI